MSKTLGILGGMGPLATVNLFEKIVQITDAVSDQDHIHILIDNNTSIPDRTAYLMSGGDDPREKLVASAKKLQDMGAEFMIMPCNTAHYFYDDIKKSIGIPFLNMIEQTAAFVAEKYPDTVKVGLLSTEGTSRLGIYDKYFKNVKVEVVKPDKVHQSYLTELIYGIKKGRRDMCLDDFYGVLEGFRQQEVNVFILGCTELSVIYEAYGLSGNYVDPVQVIAEHAVQFSGKKLMYS